MLLNPLRGEEWGRNVDYEAEEVLTFFLERGNTEVLVLDI